MKSLVERRISDLSAVAADSTLAWVEISGHERTKIEAALQAVMRENAYRPGLSLPGEFVFEKKGSTLNAFTYGGWTSGVRVRIKTTLVPQPSGAVILSCNSYVVSGAGTRCSRRNINLPGCTGPPTKNCSMQCGRAWRAEVRRVFGLRRHVAALAAPWIGSRALDDSRALAVGGA